MEKKDDKYIDLTSEQIAADEVEFLLYKDLTCLCFTIPEPSVHSFTKGVKATYKPSENFIYIDGLPVCYATSEMGTTFFCRNDDGQGNLRHKLTFAIAQSDRRRIHSDGTIARFTEDELKEIRTNWSHFLKDTLPEVILFNLRFYNAYIDELKRFANAVNIRVNLTEEETEAISEEETKNNRTNPNVKIISGADVTIN